MVYGFGYRENFRYSMPTNFLTFTHIPSICLFQLKSVDIRMPKYLYSLTKSSGQPSSDNVGVVTFRLRDSNMLLHFVTLNTIKLLQDHSKMESTSFCRLVRSTLDEIGLYNIMSSAYRDILLPSERGTEVILSMYMKKRSGPKLNPAELQRLLW